MLYSGRAAKTPWTQTGGGTNYQCFPNNPQYSVFHPGVNDIASFAYGVEYASSNLPKLMGVNTWDNVPCAVCYVRTRIAKLMIPARMACPNK